jgi:hypothetical protein
MMLLLLLLAVGNVVQPFAAQTAAESLAVSAILLRAVLAALVQGGHA